MWQCEKLLIRREKWRGDCCFIREKINSVTQGICELTLHLFFLELWALSEILKYADTFPHRSTQSLLLGRNLKKKQLFRGLEPMLTSRTTNKINTSTEQKMGWELLHSSPSRNNSFFKYSVETTLYFELTLANIYLQNLFLLTYFFLGRRNHLILIQPLFGRPTIVLLL